MMIYSDAVQSITEDQDVTWEEAEIIYANLLDAFTEQDARR